MKLLTKVNYKDYFDFHCLACHSEKYTKQVKRYFKGMSTEEYDEDDVHEFLDKSMATQHKEPFEQLSVTDLLKPIL